MTTIGCQVVIERLKHINNEIGDGSGMNQYKSLRGQDKLEFALELKGGQECGLHDCRSTARQGCSPFAHNVGRVATRLS